jgi:protein-L-isoaspartate(D-aspartate) O-methyltransferase
VEEARRRLLDRLKREVPDDRVIGAMERVPRELFVPERSRHLAYEDIPVPIGEGQTISQPYIVALMMRGLAVRRTDKALEIGTGSGYQAAILAELASRVISVERIAALAESARERLASLGYINVDVVLAEERLGWEREAPYDAMVVAAGAPKLVRGLMDQIAVGGRLLIPVGSRDSQRLMKVTRTGEGFSVETMGECRFVPLVGEEAWPETEVDGTDEPG